jgi:hypothetical protein
MAQAAGDGRVADTPEAVRARMEATRAALVEKVEALKERLFDPIPSPVPGEPPTMPAPKKKAAADKKAKSATKVSASRTTAKKASGSKSPTHKAAGKKAAATRARKTAAARGASRSHARKGRSRSKSNPLMKKVKEVATHVLEGAAAGAAAGALQAVMPMEQHAAEELRHTAGTKGSGGQSQGEASGQSSQ